MYIDMIPNNIFPWGVSTECILTWFQITCSRGEFLQNVYWFQITCSRGEFLQNVHWHDSKSHVPVGSFYRMYIDITPDHMFPWWVSTECILIPNHMFPWWVSTECILTWFQITCSRGEFLQNVYWHDSKSHAPVVSFYRMYIDSKSHVTVYWINRGTCFTSRDHMGNCVRQN